MEKKINYQAELFANRLTKNYKQLKKWARKNEVSCYRLYDKDIPEIPLALDLYVFLPEYACSRKECASYTKTLAQAVSENNPGAVAMLKAEKENTYVHMYLYDRPYEKDEGEEEIWLYAMKREAVRVLEINENNVIIKHRKKQTDGDKREQYTKIDSKQTVKGVVQECGNLFNVNLSEYLDTGLFFDHRPLRNTVSSECQGKNVLNLFCYTGSFSVYSAAGNAETVTSIDLSNTYLDWARRNMELNGFKDGSRYFYKACDVFKFLEDNQNDSYKYDVIILDPPTFSNSKKTKNVLDINRDWSTLVKLCTNLLSEEGVLYFSTNSKNIKFNPALLPQGYIAKDITAQTIPEDYRNKKIHQAWRISK